MQVITAQKEPRVPSVQLASTATTRARPRLASIALEASTPLARVETLYLPVQTALRASTLIIMVLPLPLIALVALQAPITALRAWSTPLLAGRAPWESGVPP